ncbi:MAG: hypothetical protein AAF532_09685 [Planctomycetota bacterium]
MPLSVAGDELRTVDYPRPRSRRFRRAIEWIAFEDSWGDDDTVCELKGYRTVALVADLYGTRLVFVASLVWKLRQVVGGEYRPITDDEWRAIYRWQSKLSPTFGSFNPGTSAMGAV